MVFLPPLLKVQCQYFLDFGNPWGKSNGKKWYQIWTLLLIKGVKAPRQKSFFFFFKDFFICLPCLNVFLTPLHEVQYPNFSIFLEFLGKSNENKWSLIGKLMLIQVVKTRRRKKIVFWPILPYKQDCFGICATIPIGQEMLCLLYAGFLTDPV